jgi:hypothetical protein
MSIKYRTSAGTSASNFTDLVVKVGDTLPIGAIVEYDTSETIPNGWEIYTSGKIKKISPTTPANGNIENQYGTSQTNAYSEEYSNNTFATKDVENYSTTETRIGTWDGKPLYRKVVTFNSPTGSTSSVDVPALSIANAVMRNYHAVIILDNGYAINENYQESAYAACSMAISLANGNVYFPQHSAITTSATITLTVEYTKTTD